MKKLLLIISLMQLNLIFSASVSSKPKTIQSDETEHDFAYQAYLFKCFKERKEIVHSLIGLNDSTGITDFVGFVNPISYDQWKKNGQELIAKVSQRDTESAKKLIESGEVDINCKNKQGIIPLMILIVLGWMETTAKLIIEHGADVNAFDNNGYTVLMLAANSINITQELFKLLLDKEGIDVNAKAKDNKTALILATENRSERGSDDLINLLKQFGAEGNI